MAIQVPSYAGDPTSTSPVVDAYVQVIDFHLSSARQAIGFTVGYYRSRADYLAGVAPVNAATYAITPNRESRADGAAIPSYADVVGSAVVAAGDPAGTPAFAIVSRSISMFLLSLPEFAGASLVA